MPQTLNMHHSSNFDAFFPVKINKMWNFCLKLWFFRNLELITTQAETQNLWHCIWHASNPKYTPLKQFRCIFPSQNQQNVKFGCFLNSPWQKTEKKCQFAQGKSVHKGLQICAHIGFWVCQLQCTMLELCVTSTFWVIMVFLHFYGKVKI